MGSCEERHLVVRSGFSLVELLVVLLIFAILVSIAVPTLISMQPERNLAAAADKLANDFNYCRAKAEATGNTVYMAFETRPDVLQLEGALDLATGNEVQTPTKIGEAYLNPGNPGIARVVKAYYIVEERPRWNDDNSPYTYLNWLDDYDKWVSDPNTFDYPVEPLFPFSVRETYASGALPDPALGPFNDVAAPMSVYCQDMRTGTYNTTYEERHRVLPRDLYGSAGWISGHREDQQFKVFCTADQTEILSFDQNPDGAGYNPGNEVLRSYDKIPGGLEGSYPGSHGDHPRLKDPVLDYVLLKRVALPDHVVLINPWHNTWVVGWEDVGNARYYEYQDMQFLQYAWTFKPNGETVMSEWGYDPEPFPDGTFAGLVHGTMVQRAGVPTVHMMWMVIEECLDGGPATVQARQNLNTDRRKSNQNMSGRMLCFWPLNGKYVVADYTPNDVQRQLASRDDPRLNLAYSYESDSTNEEWETILVAREYGYSQNFLVPPPATSMLLEP